MSFAGLKFKLKELKLSHWATFPVFFGQVTSAYEGIGTVSSMPDFGTVIIYTCKFEVFIKVNRN